MVSHAKVNIRNRIHSIIEARTTNEPTPYQLSSIPTPYPLHELKLLSRFMEAGIMRFWNRNSAQGILTSPNYWNPESKFQRILNPVPGIRNTQGGIHTILNSLGSIVETHLIAMFKI